MKPRTIIIVAVAAITLYLAAHGPLYRVWAFGNAPESVRWAIEVAYLPVWWLCDRSELVREGMHAYRGWWCEVW